MFIIYVIYHYIFYHCVSVEKKANEFNRYLNRAYIYSSNTLHKYNKKKGI